MTIEKISDTLHMLVREAAENTTEVKLLTDRVDKTFNRIQDDIKDLSAKLDAVRMEPGNKWKTLGAEALKWLIAGGLGALVAGGFFYYY